MQAPNWADEDTKQHLFENVIHIIIYIKKDVFFLFYNVSQHFYRPIGYEKGLSHALSTYSCCEISDSTESYSQSTT